MKLTETTGGRTFDLTGLSLAQVQIISVSTGALVPKVAVEKCSALDDSLQYHKESAPLYNMLKEIE